MVVYGIVGVVWLLGLKRTWTKVKIVRNRPVPKECGREPGLSVGQKERLDGDMKRACSSWDEKESLWAMDRETREDGRPAEWSGAHYGSIGRTGLVTDSGRWPAPGVNNDGSCFPGPSSGTRAN